MTRNLYVKIANKLYWHQLLIGRFLIIVFVGGFFSLLLVQESHFDFFGKLWFSICGFLNVLWMTVNNFNPNRDLSDRSVRESFFVILNNFGLLVSIWPWFW